MWTEKYTTDHWNCCEFDEGGSPCCCESTEHNTESIRYVLEESTHDGVRVELVFLTEDDAEQFYLKLGFGEYKR